MKNNDQRNKFAAIIIKNNHHLPVSELRTSGDGNFDWTYNYWSSRRVIICTPDGIFQFSSEERLGCPNPDNVQIEELSTFDKREFPFVIHSTEQSTIFVKQYYKADTEEEFDEIVLEYDNCHVSLGAED